jgi:hypothetical protein
METTLDTAADAAAAPRDAAPAFWNPTAAALWSLLFSPALGAWLVMRNWQRLGRPDKARGALLWFVGVLALNVGNAVVTTAAALQGREAGLPFWTPIVVFVAWVVLSAYPQIRHIDDRHGEGYARRSWAAPLLVALVLVAAVSFLSLAAAG